MLILKKSSELIAFTFSLVIRLPGLSNFLLSISQTAVQFALLIFHPSQRLSLLLNCCFQGAVCLSQVEGLLSQVCYHSF